MEFDWPPSLLQRRRISSPVFQRGQRIITSLGKPILRRLTEEHENRATVNSLWQNGFCNESLTLGLLTSGVPISAHAIVAPIYAPTTNASDTLLKLWRGRSGGTARNSAMFNNALADRQTRTGKGDNGRRNGRAAAALSASENGEGLVLTDRRMKYVWTCPTRLSTTRTPINPAILHQYSFAYSFMRKILWA